MLQIPRALAVFALWKVAHMSETHTFGSLAAINIVQPTNNRCHSGI